MIGVAHEWVSFDGQDGATYLFDVSFLASNWTCIFGNGCKGILPESAIELSQGCCSYGAHFTDDADEAALLKAAARLNAAQWQRIDLVDSSPVHTDAQGDRTTKTVDGACCFHNDTDFPGGSGCALHRGALDAGERPLDWKPDVCWQLPLRLDEHLDDNEHHTFILREWKLRDWGEGGKEFHWWCTEEDDAFIDREAVYQTLRDEIIELVGPAPYAFLVEYLDGQRGQTALDHPVRRIPVRSA